jgi:hypothetical protein
MTTAHQQQVYEQASAEHQHIRLLLGEIRRVLGELSDTQSRLADEAPYPSRGPVLQRLSELVAQFRLRFEQEGASGEVEIALACDRRLDAEVSALADRRKRLEQTLSGLLDSFAKTEYLPAQFEPLENTFAEFSLDLLNYLSDKMDALRRSLSSTHELVVND